MKKVHIAPKGTIDPYPKKTNPSGIEALFIHALMMTAIDSQQCNEIVVKALGE